MLAPLRDNPQRRSVVQPVTFPSPVEGWDASSALAAMGNLRAVQLKNFFPQPGYVEVRRGYQVQALLPGLTTPIEALMPWTGLTSQKLFAAGGGSIYDVTATASAQKGNDTYTKVLLQCDGTDAATTFTDSNRGGSAHTWTAAGNAQIDTAQSKFGGASGLFDGTGDYVTTPDHADFALGSGAFTVDFWFRCNVASGSQENLCGQCDSTPSNASTSFRIHRTTGNVIEAVVCVSTTAYTVTGTTQFTSSTNTGWHHCALVRTADTLRLFVDGTQEGGDVAISGTVNNSSEVLALGAEGAVTSNPWTGWIDEFRLSVGVARWTTNFTAPTLAYAIASEAVVTSLNEDRWQWVNFSNSGANYLYIVNGTDSARHYNGTTWAAPTITGVSSSDLVHINVHKKRIWFVQKDTTKAWYLATDAISGAATSFELGSLFGLGGYLVAMATWTIDGGLGPDDFAVFISSRGQCAIYQGTDPANAQTWELVGVYDLPAPIGRRCFAKYGGNLLLLTVSGVLQLNLALRSDKSQLAATAITERINQAMNAAARSYKDNFGWDLTVYPRGTRMVVNIPISELTTATQYVMNTLTGAWCEFDSHDACCWTVFQEKLYFGGVNSAVYQDDTGSGDITSAIIATGQTAYQPFFSPGTLKRFTMVEPLVRAVGASRPSVAISTDFIEAGQLSTPTGASASSSSLWGTAVWGTDVWGGIDASYVSDWTSATGLGRWASVKFQATTGTENPTNDETMQINGFVALAEVGGAI